MNRGRQRLAVVMAIALTLSGTVAVSGVGLVQPASAASIQGEPDLDVYLPQDTVLPGEKTMVNLTVANEGDMTFGTPDSRSIATAAHDVRVSAGAEGPLVIETAEQAIGTVTEDRPLPAPLLMTIPAGTEPGTYEIEVELEYKHTSVYSLPSGAVNDQDRTETETVEITVDDAPRFDVESVSSDVRVGDRGSIAVTVANTGSQPAENVRMTLESSSSKFLFGESSAGTTRAESLDPGENTTLRYDVMVRPEASVREFALSGIVRYTDPDGIQGVDRDLSAGVTPSEEQTFAIESADSTLRVGEDGELHGTITNTGPVAADDVVVQFADQSATLIPVESSVAIGSLEPGADASFVLPVEVTTSGKAVDRSIDLAVRYRNEDGEQRAYQDVNMFAAVAEQRDQFDVELASTAIAAGGSRTVTATVTNQLDEPVSNINVKLFVDDPLDSDEDEGYIGSLAPGESKTVTLQMNADESAIAKTYPADIDVQYEDSDGTSKISNTVTVPISVTESEDSGQPWLLIAGGVALLIVVLGGYWYRRE